jgi:hypothetical protein
MVSLGWLKLRLVVECSRLEPFSVLRASGVVVPHLFVSDHKDLVT